MIVQAFGELLSQCLPNVLDDRVLPGVHVALGLEDVPPGAYLVEMLFRDALFLGQVHDLEVQEDRVVVLDALDKFVDEPIQIGLELMAVDDRLSSLSRSKTLRGGLLSQWSSLLCFGP